jgi:hypothetical protein
MLHIYQDGLAHGGAQIPDGGEGEEPAARHVAPQFQITYLLAVLPGLEAAFPKIEQKSTAIWRKLTAISNLSTIPLLSRYFWSFRKSFGMFTSHNSFKIKFRYLSATFG